MSFNAHQLLEQLRVHNRYRDVRAVTPISSTQVLIDGRAVHLFSGNDYLGLSGDLRVKDALARAAQQYGMGPRGAALICGYTDEHAALESELAELKGTESALLFPTGFQTNLGLLTALGSEETAFFSDALNHASIIDGCRLAKGAVFVYAHRDMNALETLLKQSTARIKVVVTDALFSMDGTLAPLPDIVELCQRYGALIVLDEAHSTLVFGAHGGGVAEHFGLVDRVDFHVGTLSKAVGTHGGFIATSAERRQWLLNTARSYVFTTALPLPIVSATRAALKAATPVLRSRLWDNVTQLTEALSLSAKSPIIPIVLGDEQRTLEVAASLFEAGFHIGAIRPPTVAKGTSRLRITVSAAHTEPTIDQLAKLLGHAL